MYLLVGKIQKFSNVLKVLNVNDSLCRMVAANVIYYVLGYLY